MLYRFRKMTKNDGPIDRSFEATDMLHACQLVSNAWFGKTKVVEWRRCVSAITLIGHAEPGEGNVIGTVYDLN